MARWLPRVRNGVPDTPSNPRRLTADPCNKVPRSDILREANVHRPPKLEHAVQRGDSNGHLGHLPASGPRAQRVTDHSLVAANIGLHQGTPIVTRCPLPAHATALGYQLQVPVALGRRELCRCAWHSARTRRYNDRRIRMTLADLTVDIVPIVRPIAGKRRNRARNLLQQGTDLRAVIDILAGQLGGNNLSRVGVHPDMELSPGPAHLCGVLFDQPLTGTAELEPGAVHQQVYRFAARSWSRHRQCFAPSADGRMVWRREIKTKQPKNGCEQPFGLAERQAENRPQRQRRGDRQCRVARLAAARGAWLGLPRRNRAFREPDGQAPALAQGDVIGGPIRHSVPLLRDVVTAILVRFEWHETVRGQERAPPPIPSTPRRQTINPCNKVVRGTCRVEPAPQQKGAGPQQKDAIMKVLIIAAVFALVAAAASAQQLRIFGTLDRG